MKRNKQSPDRPLNKERVTVDEEKSVIPVDLDLSNGSEQSNFLIFNFCQHTANLNMEDPTEVNIKDVLIAITPILNINIPGWSDLAMSRMNTKDPLFRRVYQKVANYMRNKSVFLEHVDGLRSKAKSGAKSARSAKSEAKKVLKINKVSMSEQGCSSKEVSQSYSDANEEPADESSGEEYNPPSLKMAPIKDRGPYDEDLMWYHIDHANNPLNKAKVKVKYYRLKLAYWERKLKII